MPAKCSCADLNAVTEGSEDRANAIAESAPRCVCESESLSPYSPGPVQPHETIARMVCVPIHVNRKKPDLLPSFFNHAFSLGLSAQRLESASDQELVAWLNRFVGGADDRVWLGYVQTSCGKLRQVERDGAADERAFCVYDAALEASPSHVEVCAAYRIIEEADRLEARAKLRRAFSDGKVFSRGSLREGAIAAQVDAELLARPMPEHWQGLVA